MKIYIKGIILVSFLLTSIFAFSQQTIIVDEGEDSFVWNLSRKVEQYKNAETSVFGDRYFLDLSQWTWSGTSGERIALINFDIPEIRNAEIISAKLHLYGVTINHPTYPAAHSKLSSDNDFYLYRITSPWNQENVCWNNKPNYTQSNAILVKGSLIPNGNLEDIDVTNLVIDTYNDFENSHGFYLKIKNPQRYREQVFASFENEDDNLHPVLEITYRGTAKNKTRTKNKKKKKKNKTTKEEKETYTIVIYDTEGKEVQRIKNIKIKKNKTKAGMFNFNIIKNKNIEASGKVIVY